MKPFQILIGVAFGFVCTTIDSWPTWAVLVLAFIICVALLLAELYKEMRNDPADRYTPSPTDTPIADYLDRKYGNK